MATEHEPRLEANKEYRPVETSDLWTDNHSEKSRKRRKAFMEDESRCSQLIIIRCADSRYIITYKGAIAIPTIGAGGPREPYHRLLLSPCAPGIIVLPHVPCGGLGEKENQIRNGVSDNVEDSQKFVKEHIHDSDIIVQVAKEAAKISRLAPDKPVLAAIHTPQTGGIFTLAVYENGTPDLNKKLPDVFEEFLRNNKQYVSWLKGEVPNLEEVQELQDPGLLVLTNNAMPLEIVYPEITRQPGSVFRLLIPLPENEEIQRIDPKHANLVIEQAHYPVIHAIRNHGIPGKPFNKKAIDRIQVDTRSMDASSDMTTRLADKSWFKEWVALGDKKLFISKTGYDKDTGLKGDLIDIEEVKLDKAA